MKFWILSKYKIPSLEGNEPEFLPDDLIEAILDSQNRIVTDANNLSEMRRIHTNLKHCYTFDGCKYQKSKGKCDV